MELVDIHTFVNMDMDSESRVIAPTSAREIRNLRLNEFGKSGIPVGMRGTKKIHGLQVDPDIPPVVKTTGTITVNVSVFEDPVDATYFRIILTGRSRKRPVVSAFVNQFAPAIFIDIPLDIYDITQEIPTGYQNKSITTTPVTITVGNRNAVVNIVNEPIPITPIKYGALYNWYAASKNGGSGIGSISPIGWHVPSESEYNSLYAITGNPIFDFVYYGKFRSPDGSFISGVYTYYRISNTTLVRIQSGLYFNTTSGNNQLGGSLRLIKDNSTDTGTVTDIDGNIYPTTKIGDKVWMAANLAVTKFNDGMAIPNVTDNSAWAALTTEGYCWYDNDINNK